MIEQLFVRQQRLSLSIVNIMHRSFARTAKGCQIYSLRQRQVEMAHLAHLAKIDQLHLERKLLEKENQPNNYLNQKSASQMHWLASSDDQRKLQSLLYSPANGHSRKEKQRGPLPSSDSQRPRRAQKLNSQMDQGFSRGRPSLQRLSRDGVCLESITQSSIRQILAKWECPFSSNIPNHQLRGGVARMSLENAKILDKQLTAAGREELEQVRDQLSLQHQPILVHYRTTIPEMLSRKLIGSQVEKERSYRRLEEIDEKQRCEGGRKSHKSFAGYQPSDYGSHLGEAESLKGRSSRGKSTKRVRFQESANSTHGIPSRGKTPNRKDKRKKHSKPSSIFSKQPSAPRSDGKQCLLNKIQNRLKHSEAVFLDSKHRNLKHEADHLEKSHELERGLRKELIRQIHRRLP